MSTDRPAGADHADHAGHQDRLERVVVGDVPEDGAEVRAWREECPACAGELDGLTRLARILDRLGGEEREDVPLSIAGAGEPSAVSEEDELRAAIERLAEARAGASGGTRRSWFRPLVLAAAVVIIGIGMRAYLATDGDGAGPSGVRLGQGFPMTPAGEVAEPGTFRWEHPLPAAGSFRLRVLDQDGVEVLVVPGLTTPAWTPDEATRGRLPTRFTWEVAALSATRDPVAVDRREVTVRP